MSYGLMGGGITPSAFNDFSFLNGAVDAAYRPQAYPAVAPPAATAFMAPTSAAPMDYGSLTAGSFTDFGGLGAPGGGAPGSGGTPGMTGMQIGSTVLSGLQTLGNLWGGWQAAKMAKKQFKFAKGMALANMANQVKSYNTALSDRARSRAVMESQSDATRDAYVKDNSLRDYKG